MGKKITQEESLNRFKKKHGDRYDYSKVEYKGTKIKIKIICKVHGEFRQSPEHHWNGHKCVRCWTDEQRGLIRPNLKQKEVIKRFRKAHGYKYVYKKVKYIGQEFPVIITCRKHGNFSQLPYSHWRKEGHGCSKCAHEKSSKNQTLTKKEFIKRANKKHKNKYKYNKVVYVNATTPIIITCQEHGDFSQLPSHHMSKTGCPICNKGIKLNKDKVISNFKKVHGNIYSYEKMNYINNYTKITINCFVHGDFTQRPSLHLSGNGCPKCRESKGERTISLLLKNNNILFERQKSFVNLVNPKTNHSLFYDFYIKKLSILIEYDGQQHFEPCYMSIIGLDCAKEKFEEQKHKDQIKDNYAKENNIKLIRIPYWDFKNIEKILTKELGISIC